MGGNYFTKRNEAMIFFRADFRMGCINVDGLASMDSESELELEFGTGNGIRNGK